MAEKTLKFPSDLEKQSGGDTFIMFSPYKFAEGSTKKQDQKQNEIGFVGNAETRIYLYHPEMMQTVTQPRWGEEETGLFKTAADAYAKAQKGGVVDTMDAIGGFLSASAQKLALASTPGQMYAKSQGAIINPNLQMFFKGQSFREFGFSFTFAPKNKADAQAAIKIIQTFKKFAAPEFSSERLGYPSHWEIAAYSKGAQLHKFKSSVVINATLDSSPNQVWATFDDGTPTSVKLDLTFKETEIITQADYDGLDDDTYGY